MSHFVIPKFTDKYFVIPINKEGEVIDYLDKKSLNNIDNEIQDFDFINKSEFIGRYATPYKMGEKIE